MSKTFKYILDFQSRTSEFNRGANGIKTTLKSVATYAAAAFGTQQILAFGKASLAAYDVQAKAERNLLVALKGRKDVQQRLISQAQALQKKTLFGDEETIKAQALIAAFVKEESQIKKVIPLVQDLATAKGMDLASAADLVSKTLGSSTNALSRYGIEVKGAVGSSERLNSLTKNLTEAFGGQAEAAAEAGTGGVTQLTNAIGDLKEEIGKTIAESKSFIDYIKGSIGEVQDLSEIIGDKNRSGFGKWMLFLGGSKKRWHEVAESIRAAKAENEKAKKSASDYASVLNTNYLPAIYAVNESNKTAEGGYRMLRDIAEENAAATKKQTTTYGDVIKQIAAKTDSLKKLGINETAEARKIYAQIAALKKQKEAFEALAKIQKPRDTTSYQTLSTKHNVTVANKVETPGLADMSGVIDANNQKVNALQDTWQGYIDKMYAVAEVHAFMKGGLTQLEQAGLGLAESLMQTANSADVTLENLGSSIAETATNSIRAYIAEGVAGAVSKTLAFLPFPANIIAGGLAATAATALFNSVIPAFAFGGEIPGNNFYGDRMLARVNSGEEIIRRDDPRHIRNQGRVATQGSGRDRLIIPALKLKKGDIYISFKEAEAELQRQT